MSLPVFTCYSHLLGYTTKYVKFHQDSIAKICNKCW